MSQVINQETEHSEEFYKREIDRMLIEIKQLNQKAEYDWEEIKTLKRTNRDSQERIKQALVDLRSF